MIADIVPSSVVTVETERDLVDADLFPEEAACVGNAVEKRRREFVTGRACARRALEQLGIAPVPIASGARGEPLWPAGVVGSITHCHGYRACAAARASDIASVGIDADVHAGLPDGILEAISSPRERRRLAACARGVWMDRVLFSAKEAVYKAWFPLTGRSLGFEDVDMTLEPDEAAFRARLLVAGPVVNGERLTHLRGKWQVDGGVVLTAVVVPG